jgi:hypothetical protein
MIVLLGAMISAIVGVLSNAGRAHPPTETMRVRLSPLGDDRHDVPFQDRGRRGGAALGSRPTHRGHKARRCAVALAFVNRVRDTRLEHQQRADQQ